MSSFVGVIFFIIVAITLYGLINFYIGKSAYRAFSSIFPNIDKRLFIIFFAVIALSYIISSLTKNVMPSNVRMIFNFIGSFYLAALYYLIIFLPLVALTKFIGRKTKLNTKRIFSKISVIYAEGISVFLIVILLIGYGFFHASNPLVTEYKVETSKKSSIDNLKIAFISDVHLGVGITKSGLTEMVNRINNLNVDVVFLGGDLVDENTPTEYFSTLSESLKNLKSTYGTYAILGNHEFGASTIDQVKKIYSDGNVKLLIDEETYIDDILLIGRNDDSSKSRGFEDRKKIGDILSETKNDRNSPVIVLDHRPEDYDAYSERDFDLQLSGHTHNGQFFPNVYLTHLQYDYSYGYHKINNLNLIISSGYGTWGPPVRIGTDSEIVVVNMEFNK
ncbi:MAG: metallophosphoesterase [Clostridiaceae bacterium]